MCVCVCVCVICMYVCMHPHKYIHMYIQGKGHSVKEAKIGHATRERRMNKTAVREDEEGLEPSLRLPKPNPRSGPFA